MSRTVGQQIGNSQLCGETKRAREMVPSRQLIENELRRWGRMRTFRQHIILSRGNFALSVPRVASPAERGAARSAPPLIRVGGLSGAAQHKPRRGSTQEAGCC